MKKKTNTFKERLGTQLSLRSLEEVQKEYNQASNAAGDLQYRIFAMGLTLQQINQRMFELNQEHGAIIQKTQKEQAPEAPAPEPAKTEAPPPEATH